MASKYPKLESHPLVGKLNLDAGGPKGVVPLAGFLGPSNREGHWRIYHSSTFNNFTDVPAEAIAYAEPPRPDDDGPTTVYVQEGARVYATRIETGTLTTRFLGGAIARENLPSAPSGAHLRIDEQGATCLATNCFTLGV
jgi:hypothetical protein